MSAIKCPPIETVVQADTDIISRYQTIREHSRTMCRHARDGAWESLIEMQREYVCAVENLAAAEQGVTLHDSALEQKYHLLVEIRDAESEVRSRLNARLTELGGVMAQSRSRKRVLQAYDGGAAG